MYAHTHTSVHSELPIEDVSGHDAMRGAEPGTQLREKHVGTDGQQQRLLLNKPIAAPEHTHTNTIRLDAYT